MQSKQTKFRLIWSTRLHLVGSATFMLTGIGHLMTHFLSPETPEQLEMMHLMEQFSIDMPGTQTNLLLF